MEYMEPEKKPKSKIILAFDILRLLLAIVIVYFVTVVIFAFDADPLGWAFLFVHVLILVFWIRHLVKKYK